MVTRAAARVTVPLLMVSMLLTCGGFASASDGARAEPDCADKCAAVLGGFIRTSTPAQLEGSAVRPTRWLKTALRSCKRRATQAEEKFCLFVANQLLALSAAEAPPALLYDVKAACSQVDFGAMESVCAVRGAKAGKVPRWLAEFVPLISELQQAVDAPRGRFPDRELIASGNAIVLNHKDVHEVNYVFNHSGTPEERESIQQLFDDPSCLPPADPHRKVYASCAVVGNGGGRDPRGGAGIDRHEAVFRFNLAQTKDHEGFVGSKTTVRVLNHLRSRAMYTLLKKSSRTQPNAMVTLSQNGLTSDEYIDVSRRKWLDPGMFRGRCGLIDNFYQMRDTLLHEGHSLYHNIGALIQRQRTHLGLAAEADDGHTKDRPSAAIPALTMALVLCEQVHLFGFDMDLPAESTNGFKHFFDNGTVSRSHDYALQAGVFKVLHVAGLATICSPFLIQDVPSECFFPRQGVAGSAGRAPPQWRAPSPESRVSIR